MFKPLCFVTGLISMLMVLSVPLATIGDLLYLSFFLTSGLVFFCLATRKANP